MTEIVNLRRVRKDKARAEKGKQAEASRLLHGTPKKLRKLAEAQGEKAARELAAHKLEPENPDN
jgi:hypothetical protein